MTFDFIRSTVGDDPIIVEAEFAAARNRVFRAWTDPDIVMKWFGPAPNSLHRASIDLRPGGRFEFVESADARRTIRFEGEYLEIVPDVRLVFTWAKVIAHATGERESTSISRVELTFSESTHGTRVRVVHSGIREEAMRTGFAGGWNRAFTTMSELFERSG